MNNLILVRHGQSLWNLERRFTGWTDIDLSEQGKSEAKYAGQLINEANIEFDTYYICGPEPMIDEVSSTLKEHGVNEKFIRFELFTTSEEGALTETHEGYTQVTVTLDDDTETFQMAQDNSVLQAALDAGMDPPYSCQGGICSTCIARITEGKVEMRKNQILTDDELAEGYILTCQSHPTTPTITIDYDDI